MECACVGQMYLIVWDRLGVTDSGCPLSLNPLRAHDVLMDICSLLT